MPRWLVRLKGERFDIEDLPEFLRSSELKVVEENGAFYLQSSEFDFLTSPDEVRERGRALIKLINGVAKFDRDNYRDVSEDGITKVEDDGRSHHYVFLENAITVRAKVSAHVQAVLNHCWTWLRSTKP